VAALVAAVAMFALSGSASASTHVSFTRAWGWGVTDGQAQFEICTSSCQLGTPGGGAGQLKYPAAVTFGGVAVDGSSDVYVADTDNQRIDEFSPTGSFIRAWGWGVSDGQARLETCTSSCQTGLFGAGAGELNYPKGIAVDQSGDVYVADLSNQRIDEFSSTGAFIRTWGWGVSDGQAHLETCTSSCQTGLYGAGPGQLNDPTGVAVDGSGDVYVTDLQNERVDEFSSTGSFTRAWGWGVSDGQARFETCTSSCQPGLYGAGAGQLNYPSGVAVDGSGDVYVADSGNQRIAEFSSTGSFTRAWGWGVSDGQARLETCTSSCQTGLYGDGAGQFWYPTGVAVDGSGDVYVTDIENERVDESSSTGSFIRAWGWGVSDGQARLETCTSSCQSGLYGSAAGQLYYPAGVAVGGSGDAYVADLVNERIDGFSAAAPPRGAPTVSTGQASSLSPTSATLTGTVNPNGKTVSDCHFDWGTTSAYGNSVPCASPPGSGASDVAVSAALSGLAPGTIYHFRVAASNPAGTNDGADKTFTTTACQGEGEVRFGVVDAIGGCFRPVAAGGHNAYATTDSIKLNGIQLRPATGTTIVLDPQAETINSGGGSVSLWVGPVELGSGPIAWAGLDGGSAGRATLTDMPADTGSVLGGLPLAGTVQPTLTQDGSALIGAYVQLPAILGDVAASVSFKTNNAGAFSFDGLHLRVSSVPVGVGQYSSGGQVAPVVWLKNLDGYYNASDDSWGGAVDIKIYDWEVQGDFGLVHGRLDHLDASLSFPGSSVPLGSTGLFLDSVSLALQMNPFGFGIGAGITAGPDMFKNPINGEDVALMEVDGAGKVVLSNPVDIALDGALKIASFQVATAHMDYKWGTSLALGLNVRLPWWDNGQQPPAVRIDGGLNGWLDIPKLAFNAEGTAEACFFQCLSADVLASNIGAAACVNVFGVQVGGAYTWVDHTLHFPIGCDLSAYRATQAAADVSAAGAGRVIVLPGHLPVAGLRIRGTTGPPVVTITGPRGERITTPVTASGAKTSRYWLVKNPADDTTGVVIAHPAGGPWRITAAPGSPAITAVQAAYGLPPASVRARVSRHGRRFKLTYTINPITGQLVRFAERVGRATHLIGTGHGTHGTLTFTPAAGHAGPRTIIAIVLQNGLARQELTVASYRAPAPLKPGKPNRVTLRRQGTNLIVSWSRTADTASYAILAKLPRHRSELFELAARQHIVLIPNVLTSDHGTIVITAVDHTGVRGPSAHISF
jgi:hypothetical protein